MMETNPMMTWQRLRAGNERSVAGVRAPRVGRADTRVGMAAARPAAAVLRCADAGLASETVFAQPPGSLIEVSTWGHVVDSSVMATLEYAVEIAEVPLIVVLGHPGCGAVRSAMRAWDEVELPSGGARTTIEQIFGSIVRRNASTASIEEVATAHIIETGLSLLDRSPLIAQRVDAGACGIVCAAVRPQDGRITTYATVGPVGEPAETLLECV